MSEPSVRVLEAWPAEVARFVADSPDATWGASPAFRRALERAGPGWPPLLFVADDARGVRGVLAGALERRWGGTWFRCMPFGAPAGPWLDRGDDRAQVAGALWRALAVHARAHGWLGGDVTLWGGTGPGEDRLPPPGVGRVRHDRASRISLARGPEAWRASLDNAARRMLAQAGRRGVTVARAATGDELAAVYALYREQARAWHLRHVLPAEFYRELLAPPTDAGLWVARLAGEIVCGVLAFVSPRETYAWWSGSSPRARGVRAFPATLERIAFECGSEWLNLGFSGARARIVDFKRQLGAEDVPVPIVDLTPRPRNPYHALLSWARERARTGPPGARPVRGADGPPGASAPEEDG